MARHKPVTIDQFQEWLGGLCDLDQENFKILINLPTALEVLAKMPEGRYREMAIFGVALLRVIDRGAESEVHSSLR